MLQSRGSNIEYRTSNIEHRVGGEHSDRTTL